MEDFKVGSQSAQSARFVVIMIQDFETSFHAFDEQRSYRIAKKFSFQTVT